MSRTPQRLSRAAHRAFTLLEIMIALAILGLLVGLAVTNLGDTFDRAKVSAAKLYVNDSIKLPLNLYRMQMGDYPSTAEGLQALVAAPASRADQWRGPYIEDPTKLIDPWGEPYQYRFPGTKNKSGPDVFSKGPDHLEGTADDIGNWPDSAK